MTPLHPSTRFRRLAWALAVANLVANIGIVVTGGAVRLTGSGLGCPTWPRCTDESYVAHGELGIHGAIEFGNRMLTFVLVVLAIALWVTMLVGLVRTWRGRRAWRPFWLATVVVLGIPAQAVIGGITVHTDLNPWIVSLHLLVSMAIIAVCVVLLDELRSPDRDASPRLAPLTWAVFAVTWVVLYLGTVVTGSGPHSGDLDSRRTGLDPQVMSHVHAAAVYLLLALTVALVVLARRVGSPTLAHAALVLLVLELAQGVVGFVQYFTDLPEVLVGIHMLGAALVSASVTWVVLAGRGRHRA
ncbi:COX15/CtaA family protein [Nocardioides sp. Soil805]|uniref:COX15/CtaA family protein n=1 Tax=Nocardioides sp. Soil805 TaxID=1736416 RepID=UPI00070311ED|nr:COX15/CtaA family protein [Nocardioides sp. Soil805]KRF36064.1 cytochrome oxidase assembly protein [Nocardioides sp. Soil805]